MVSHTVACSAGAYTLVVDGLADGKNAVLTNHASDSVRVVRVDAAGTAPTGAPGNLGIDLPGRTSYVFDGGDSGSDIYVYAWGAVTLGVDSPTATIPA